MYIKVVVTLSQMSAGCATAHALTTLLYRAIGARGRDKKRGGKCRP